jgi:exodeoxyribonuclease-3
MKDSDFMPLTIVTYNVNGIRSAIGKGLIDWMKANPFDIYCLQEVKAHPGQVDMTPFGEMGYHAYWSPAEKKGYSGVLTLSRREADKVVSGCGIAEYDSEGRILRTDFGELTLLNCYFPSGTTGETRQSVKMRFLDDFFQWAAELRRQRGSMIIVGDYNIAHQEIDIHDPVGNKKSSGFLPEERAWMSKWFSNGYTDAFRYLNPDRVEYSWWTFRMRAREKNKGWRIDYQSVTDNLRDKLLQARQLADVNHSDHCPVLLEIDL